jgi:hypothetical protein
MLLWIAVTFVAYLRPGEAMRLRGKNLVAPTAAAGACYSRWALLLHDTLDARPGKTGLYDESVVFDHECWIYPALEALKIATAPGQSLWDFSLTELQSAFKHAVAALGLERLRPHLYSLRHGGASEDILVGRRTPEQVQRRGRWAAPSSMKRYAKESKLLAELQFLPQHTFEFGKLVEANFVDTLAGALRDTGHPLRRQLPPVLLPVVGRRPALLSRGQKRRR